MPTSQNGWPAYPVMTTRKLIVEGVEFVGGIVDNDDVETVLRYCMENYHRRVEPLHNPGCWGGNYRANRNDPDDLSNHASRTALDANAPSHPNGVATSKTFTPKQFDTCHDICDEVDNVVRWGGDYRSTPDAMHWEINANAAAVHAVAVKLRAKTPSVPGRDEVTAERRRLGKLARALKPGWLKDKVKAARDKLPRPKKSKGNTSK